MWCGSSVCVASYNTRENTRQWNRAVQPGGAAFLPDAGQALRNAGEARVHLFDLRGAACQLFAKLLGGILGVCSTGFEVGDVCFGIPDHVWQVADCFIYRIDNGWV